MQKRPAALRCIRQLYQYVVQLQERLNLPLVMQDFGFQAEFSQLFDQARTHASIRVGADGVRRLVSQDALQRRHGALSGELICRRRARQHRGPAKSYPYQQLRGE